MRIGSLVLVALLAMVLNLGASAETDPTLASNDQAGSVEVAPESSDPSPVAETGSLEHEVVEVEVADPPPAVAWDDFDDPDFKPGDSTLQASDISEDADAVAEAGAETSETELMQVGVEAAAASPIEIEGPSLVVNGITLGPVGVDSEGRVGRVHTVTRGDTLWDVSNAYLGTAWVWPSVWKDNREIQNPHLIEPGDRLWISSTEIRPISDAEADEYLADNDTLEEELTEVDEAFVEVAAESPDDFEPEFSEEVPASDDEFAQLAATDEFEIDGMDQLPVGMPDEGEQGRGTGRTIRVSMRDNMGFVSDVQLKASTTILGSPSDRLHLSLLDTIYFGLGEGEVEVGDEFTFFRNITDVRLPDTNELIGYHVDVLGWAEVIEVTGETCVAVIRVSLDGAMRGDLVMPRYQTPTDIEVKFAEEGIEGQVAFMPSSRTLMGTSDYVFVNVGAVQGVEVGTDLEVYDPGYQVYDRSRNQRVRTPDRVIADLVVVTVQEESAVAFVAHTRREITIGDVVRGATRHFPKAF